MHIQDKQVMKYSLYLPLFGKIDVDPSYYEVQSVGRIYIHLFKLNKPERWRRLLEGTEKPPNMSLWWEIHEKYDEDLVKHTQFETDDEIEQFIHIDNSGAKKKKKSKKQKKESNRIDYLVEKEEL